MPKSTTISAHERRLQIAQQVQDQGSVRVAALMHAYQVSDTAIRRDLEILEAQGRLRRIHGGAVAASRSQASHLFQAKARQRAAEKARLGLAAAGLVHPGESVILDSGTTILQVAHSLPKLVTGPTLLTIVTNSLPVVAELQEYSFIQLNLLGGIILPEFQATVGPQAVANLRRVQVDKAFIGCDGLTVSHGLTIPHMLVAEVERAMVEVARQVIVVADSSKLGRVGFTQIAPLSAVQRLITDADAPPDLVAEIQEAGVQVTLV